MPVTQYRNLLSNKQVLFCCLLPET